MQTIVKHTAIVALMAAITSGAIAQQRMSLYAPGLSVKDQQIGLRSWGSGTVSEAKDLAYEGTTSVRINTRNFFQGGILTFAKTIDVSSAFGDANNLLEITYQIPDSKTVIPANGPPGFPIPGQPGFPGGTPPSGTRPGGGGGRLGGGGLVLNVPGIGMAVGQGGRGGGEGGGGLGGGGGQGGGGLGLPGGNSQPVAGIVEREPVKELRIVVTTTDDLKSELYIPITSSYSGVRGWKSTAFPLSSILGFSRTNKIIKEVALSADTFATIYVGRMRIFTDSTPISLQVPFDSLNLALGDQVVLNAAGYAGSTLLKYEWDFNESDGIQVDSEGPSVKRSFRKPGSYTITVTARDMYGQKTPVSKKIKVVVNP